MAGASGNPLEIKVVVKISQTFCGYLLVCIISNKKKNEIRKLGHHARKRDTIHSSCAIVACNICFQMWVYLIRSYIDRGELRKMLYIECISSN